MIPLYGALAILSAAMATFIALNHPLWPALLAVALVVWSVAVCLRPLLWLAVLPACLPLAGADALQQLVASLDRAIAPFRQHGTQAGAPHEALQAVAQQDRERQARLPSAEQAALWLQQQPGYRVLRQLTPLPAAEGQVRAPALKQVSDPVRITAPISRASRRSRAAAARSAISSTLRALRASGRCIRTMARPPSRSILRVL